MYQKWSQNVAYREVPDVKDFVVHKNIHSAQSNQWKLA